MYFTTDEAILFARNHQQEFIDLAQETQHTIILCPAFLEFREISQLFKNTAIKRGAQDCSAHENGAYTGQVSAESIKKSGGDYCIIGHSEKRMYQGETDEMVAQKCSLLLDAGITPILCIGEDVAAYEQKNTLAMLEKQLTPIFSMLSKQTFQDKVICIAYEPVWSIGTGKIPSLSELTMVFDWLKAYTVKHNAISWPFMYGGSVNENTMDILTNLDNVHGFLIGSASLNFQTLKKIVGYNLL